MTCPLCGAAAELRYAGHPGYRQPDLYDICHCARCNTSFAQPLAAEAALYEQIYRERRRLRGYADYARFAREVLSHPDPLAYISDEQETYWSIADYFAAIEPREGRRVIEIGSGLGYLTYALRKRGHECTGLDISPTAVAEATAAYGEFYVCADVFDYASRHPASCDVVVMTELIEHVDDPGSFLEAVQRLLKPGGEIVLTTPNRSSSPGGMLWNTDSPPVHLWWFSEDSMRVLAARLGMQLRLCDFSAYSRAHGPWPVPDHADGKPTVLAALDSSGKPLKPVPACASSVRRAWRMLGLKRLRNAMRALRFRNLRDGPGVARRGTLCAVLSLTRDGR